MTIQERERNAQVESWLGLAGSSVPVDGLPGVVLAANERAARAVAAAFHETRRAAGLEAWATPAIFSWDAWVRGRWMERNSAGLMLLNTLQEHSLWVRVIRESAIGEALLDADRLATTAQQAYRLLLSHAPEAAIAKAREDWSGDAAVFSAWMSTFEGICRRDRVISGSRLAIHLAKSLREDTSTVRPPLLLIGFDRLLQGQTAVLDGWGAWRLDQGQAPSGSKQRLYRVRDDASEMRACAGWLRAQRQANPEARLLVVTPALERRRGELERALLSGDGDGEAALDFEFSLGVPLDRVGVARSALLLLRWLTESLSEPELDWLLTSGHIAGSREEEIRLAEAMLAVRGRGFERPDWALNDFVSIAGERAGSSARTGPALPATWVARVQATRDQLAQKPATRSPLDWEELVGALLDTAGWPGFRSESSEAFQARERWEKALEDCGSLGFSGAEMTWEEFLSALERSVSASIFATESAGAPIQITEPLESAGQLADGIWFLGAQEDDWPGRGTPHPLLPVGLQREYAMPHGSPAADWKLAQTATERLLVSAAEVVFSYAEQVGEAETRPSRLVMQALGAAAELPALLAAAKPDREVLSECFEDLSQVLFGKIKIAGGSGTLNSQSACAFQAFGMARLGGVKWEPAQGGLNPRERGTLLHAVMQRIWRGERSGGISTSDELHAIEDLGSFVRPIVEAVIRERWTTHLTSGRRLALAERFPERHLALEAQRLTRLVTEWLLYERRRIAFRVTSPEQAREIEVAGLRLDLRLDRVDVLEDGSLLIVDYKSSNVGPAAWNGARPDDVQLPLYATYAIDQKSERLQGLVFARIKPGKLEMCGRVRDSTTLIKGLNGQNALVKSPLTDVQLEEWRALIEQLGEDFLLGRADVDPKDIAKTCQRCHLHAVCRIYENQPLAVELAGTEDEDGALEEVQDA